MVPGLVTDTVVAPWTARRSKPSTPVPGDVDAPRAPQEGGGQPEHGHDGRDPVAGGGRPLPGLEGRNGRACRWWWWWWSEFCQRRGHVIRLLLLSLHSPPDLAHRQEPEGPDSGGPLVTGSLGSRSRAAATALGGWPWFVPLSAGLPVAAHAGGRGEFGTATAPRATGGHLRRQHNRASIRRGPRPAGMTAAGPPPLPGSWYRRLLSGGSWQRSGERPGGFGKGPTPRQASRRVRLPVLPPGADQHQTRSCRSGP
jgi:hypothetical protein